MTKDCMTHCCVHVNINIRTLFKMSIVPQVGLEPTRLTSYVPKTYVSTIPPSGYNHIRQAFYFQHREIVSNLTHLTAVWVPEDVIFCSPSWNRTTNISLEVRSYIHLTNRPSYLKRESNPHYHYW